MANDKVIHTDNIIKKNITKGKMHLNFEINTDIKGELVDFKDCLLEAILIIDKELEKFEKKKGVS